MADGVKIDSEVMFRRLERLQAQWQSHLTTDWGGADAICIPMGTSSQDQVNYSKSSAIHLYLLGYEFPDTIMILLKNKFLVMAHPKKCGYIEQAANERSGGTISVEVFHKVKDEAINKENFGRLISAIKRSGVKLGTLIKGDFAGTFIPSWVEAAAAGGLESIECALAIGKLLSVKDETEVELCKRAAVLSNKVMKHGLNKEMEEIIDKDLKKTHEQLAVLTEGIIGDPSKIGVKVAKELVESCFFPIIQSGGKYDIKVSASSNSDTLSYDVILCSLGARYKNYCANMSRTYMIDAPNKVESVYNTLLGAYEAAISAMIPGNEFKDAYKAASQYLMTKDESLAAHFPKSIGFPIGLEFRDGSLLINATNATKFADGMILNLSVGFHKVPLSGDEKAGASDTYQKMNEFSLLVADTILVQQDKPDILTKLPRDYPSVSYNLSGKGADDAEDTAVQGYSVGGTGRTLRDRKERDINEDLTIQRQMRQQELMQQRIREAMARHQAGEAGRSADEAIQAAQEIRVYRSPAEYPKDVSTHQLRIDLEREVIFAPIAGVPVPFHVSAIKSITLPEPDKATYLRINFYAPGMAFPKDGPKNVGLLIQKHQANMPFIKELTFRSLDKRNIEQIYRLYQDLKKRMKLRDQKAEQERDLVVQAKLIRIKDQRIPRLQDLTMRPTLSGRKCVGNLEAHQNGLSFTSNKGEKLDVLYSNVSNAIFQPCQNTTIVLIHFHLKDFIMIGKKKHKDVQFYTEAIDASLNIEQGGRYGDDPDELEDEQRERERRRALNNAFKDFCRKVEKVAKHYEFSIDFDIPYTELGFYGNCSREMVMVQPTVHCLVSVTEVPFFFVKLIDIEHVHFERVTYTTKNFDMIIIFKDLDVPHRQISAIDTKYLEPIQDWLNDQSITYTFGKATLQWGPTIKEVKEQIAEGIFYLDVDPETGEKKDPGWLFLCQDDPGGEEEEEDESSYSEESEESESESDSDEDSDEYEDESDDDSEYDEDDLSEEGEDWDELEKKAEAEDRKRVREQKDEKQGSKKGRR